MTRKLIFDLLSLYNLHRVEMFLGFEFISLVARLSKSSRSAIPRRFKSSKEDAVVSDSCRSIVVLGFLFDLGFLDHSKFFDTRR